VLKGALMLTAWQIPSPRPTRDTDLLGRMENSVEQVGSAVKAICQEPVPDDGLSFETNESRGTPLSLQPVAFSDAFAADSDKKVHWEAFRRRLHVEDTPATLQEVVQVMAAFLLPVTEALATGQPFHQRWDLGGPWLPANG